MSWTRPVPSVGDPTSAAERAAAPQAWAFDPVTVDALHAVIDARRDIRRFRPDPLPDDVLRRLLEAGHRAPSVGHSQPWRFVTIRDPGTRDRAAHLADRERLRQADLLEPDRRQRLLDLQLEGIREAPLGIVVACDRRAPAGGVLGRATFADTDVWSCACAIQNIWLAARAAGIGVGWVTLFPPDELAALIGLPDGVETLGWLCLGWPDERPPDPGLERQGWSQRLDLDDVVIAERWPAENGPDAPASYLSAGAPAAGSPASRPAPGGPAVVAARDTGDDLLTAPGSLGVLDAVVNRVLALPADAPRSGTLILVAANHPVTRHGVSAYPPSVTADVLAATRSGESLGAVAARRAGLRVTAEWAVPQHGQGDLLTGDALTADDVAALCDTGRRLARDAAPHGLLCLGEVGIGNTTVAAALACALLDLPPQLAVGLGAGADAAILARKRAVVEGALERARTRYGVDLATPITALAAVGGPEIAVLTGAVLGAAEAGVPVVLDGLATSVAGLLAVAIEPGARAVLVAGQRSRERAHHAVLTELGLEPLLDLRFRAGEGVAACLAAQLLLTALGVRRESGRVT